MQKFWRFGSRQKEKIGQQLEEMGRGVHEISEQVTKLTRLQYKWTQEIAQSVRLLETQIHEVLGQNANAVQTTESVILRLIAWLDGLDGLSGDSDMMNNVLERWRQEIIDVLLQFGFEQISVIGHPFDFRVAEGLGTVAPDDPIAQSVSAQPTPYLVVQVLRRGFMRDHKIYRKAYVVTVMAEETATDFDSSDEEEVDGSRE